MGRNHKKREESGVGKTRSSCVCNCNEGELSRLCSLGVGMGSCKEAPWDWPASHSAVDRDRVRSRSTHTHTPRTGQAVRASRVRGGTSEGLAGGEGEGGTRPQCTTRTFWSSHGSISRRGPAARAVAAAASISQQHQYLTSSSAGETRRERDERRGHISRIPT